MCVCVWACTEHVEFKQSSNLLYAYLTAVGILWTFIGQSVVSLRPCVEVLYTSVQFCNYGKIAQISKYFV